MGATKLYLAGIAKVVRQDGRPIVLPRKAAALLAYLALQGRAHRSSIAALLWPRAPEPAARANLREHLCYLHAKVGTCMVEGEGESLQFDPAVWVDVLHDPDGVDGRKLLAGHAYDDCPMLAAWLKSERDGLRGLQTSRLLEELDRCFGLVPG